MKNALLFLVILALSSMVAVAQPSASTSATPSSTPKDEAAKTGLTGKPGLVLPPEKAQPVRMPRFDKPPVIDGKLDDEVWQQAKLLKDFYQVQPGDNIAPSKPTEVMLGYDSKFLYVAFHCYDEPDKVRANIPKRDNIFDDDYVGILFDTFNDHRKAYEFDFNPLGVQADGIWTDGQNEDFNPDIVMESKGIVTSDGWTVEVAIPFKSLRYVAGKDKLWGAHFWRRIKRFNNELDMWMPLNRDISSWLAQEGHLSGLEGISTERTLELIPSLTLSETGKRKSSLTPAQVNSGLLDPGRFVNEPIKFDPGLTGKYTITPNVTLDFAINPDFAQVESDQLVVTANQRFPIFFAEKRPFFLEGIDIFQTQIQAVHTRAIIDPLVAVKLTGKINRNTFGLMAASDNGPGNLSEEDRDFIKADPRFLLGLTNPTASQTLAPKTRSSDFSQRPAGLWTSTTTWVVWTAAFALTHRRLSAPRCWQLCHGMTSSFPMRARRSTGERTALSMRLTTTIMRDISVLISRASGVPVTIAQMLVSIAGSTPITTMAFSVTTQNQSPRRD